MDYLHSYSPLLFSDLIFKKLVIKSKKNSTGHELVHKTNENPNILIVEDDPVNQKIISIWLNKHDYTCDIASNGREGFEKFLIKDYDFIFMDCQMPEIDGYEATKKIRLFEDSSKGSTKIIAMTAYAMKGDREKCLESGMDDYITKPIDFKLLTEKCNALFD
ncbi:MAG: response regulator [Clostridiales bacterium]|nr:response regulator [Clostridiales bacterium]